MFVLKMVMACEACAGLHPEDQRDEALVGLMQRLTDALADAVLELCKSDLLHGHVEQEARSHAQQYGQYNYMHPKPPGPPTIEAPFRVVRDHTDVLQLVAGLFAGLRQWLSPALALVSGEIWLSRCQVATPSADQQACTILTHQHRPGAKVASR